MRYSLKFIGLIPLPILVFLVVVWRLYLVPHYPIHEDELISFQVLPSIAERGLPLVGGLIYWRALFAYYLMAIPVFFLGLSEYSARFVPILCSGLLLPVIYALGKRCGSAAAGWIAVIFLAVSSFENVMANFSRFYLPLQLFFCLSVLLICLSFSTRKPSYAVALFVSTLFAIGSHRLAVELFFFYGVGVVVLRRLDLLRSSRAWLFMISIAVSIYFFWFWSPGNTLSGAGTLPVVMGALVNNWFFYDLINRFVPFGWLFIVLGIYPALRTGEKGWLYLLCGYGISFFVFSLVAPSDSERYVVHLFPLAVLLAALSIVFWVKEFHFAIKNRMIDKKTALSFIVTIFLLLPFNFRDFKSGDIFESIGTSITYRDQKPAHEFLKRNMGRNDILISTEPEMTKFYLQTDKKIYFLREYYDVEQKAYGEFPARIRSPRDDYYIDSPEKLKQLLAGHKGKIWLYANWKIEKTISLEMDKLVKEKFRGVFSQNQTYVLLAL